MTDDFAPADRLIPIGRPAARTHLLERLLAIGTGSDEGGAGADASGGPGAQLAHALAEAARAGDLLWLPAPDLHALTLDMPTVAGVLSMPTALERSPSLLAVMWDNPEPDRLWVAAVRYSAENDGLTATAAWSDGVDGKIGVLPVMAVHRPAERGVGLAQTPGVDGPPPEGDRLKRHMAVLVRPLVYARLHLSGRLRAAEDGALTYEPTPGTGGAIGSA